MRFIYKERGREKESSRLPCMYLFIYVCACLWHSGLCKGGSYNVIRNIWSNNITLSTFRFHRHRADNMLFYQIELFRRKVKIEKELSCLHLWLFRFCLSVNTTRIASTITDNHTLANQILFSDVTFFATHIFFVCIIRWLLC